MYEVDFQATYTVWIRIRTEVDAVPHNWLAHSQLPSYKSRVLVLREYFYIPDGKEGEFISGKCKSILSCLIKKLRVIMDKKPIEKNRFVIHRRTNYLF